MERNQTKEADIGKKKMKDETWATGLVLEELRIPTQIKLAGLWATVMFMYIYVDIIGFYQPGLIEQIITGKVLTVDIDQIWMLSMLALMTIPTLMVFLSLALPAKANRYANLGLGVFLICIALGTASGATGVYYVFGSGVEIVLLSLIVWIAWKWPRISRNSSTGDAQQSPINEITKAME